MMKDNILLFVLLMITTSGWCQYTSIFDADTTRYGIKVEVFDGAIDSEVYIYGDSLIDDLSYKLVDSGSEDYEIDPFRVGFVREDTTSGQIWFRRVADTEELIVMDLSLELGDTFPIYDEHLSCTDAGEAEVKSIKYEGDRKVITLDCRYGVGVIHDTIRFIEGIGPNATIFFQTLDLNIDENNPEGILSGFAYSLCAMYKADTLYYPEQGVELCNVHISTEEVGEKDLEIYPNPTTGNLVLIAGEPIKAVSIYAINGRLERRIFQATELDLSFLKPGMYVLKVEFASGDLVLEKLMKM
ncbi:MAG: hypothetical protein DHS20C18_17990 [Saprospiraceae bacterium]|nr:MAG: hypothetical protein DHS20C18_17990 [Saprospiraceae bacterium]